MIEKGKKKNKSLTQLDPNFLIVHFMCDHKKRNGSEATKISITVKYTHPKCAKFENCILINQI